MTSTQLNNVESSLVGTRNVIYSSKTLKQTITLKQDRKFEAKEDYNENKEFKFGTWKVENSQLILSITKKVIDNEIEDTYVRDNIKETEKYHVQGTEIYKSKPQKKKN